MLVNRTYRDLHAEDPDTQSKVNAMKQENVLPSRQKGRQAQPDSKGIKENASRYETQQICAFFTPKGGRGQ